ncbi:succinate-semialdehyde dehydrogenase/glutarate-semialdehyde dehydrogenase [Balneicella halophila]|uniref:Succinate-semialdehyde dehydrogenase/glutarate-semialdehyde dehydrogenase n=1 Tax=Balneicella halophila TaxID=1537566 RepID=A0A7L4UN25_BALHA|nr:NAD-dependent succinate-semialdehyde dehydrogenase [Balneicella halophila]PVX50031.1 succinate-semialdehyde dehydrogenase/glutarate-semialdehyde dehydrogenase [Balneicella halophila]
MKSINPYNNEVVFENTAITIEEVNNAIDASHNAFLKWRTTSMENRSKLFSKLSDVLEENKQKWGKVMTLEMGKPISQAIAEVEKCAWVCRYYAKNADSQLASMEIETDATYSGVRYDPLGVILGVMPWNFPFWQVLRFATPTIMAGNTALLKHASNVTESAKCIAEAFEKAGFPSGVFTFLPIESEKVEAIIKNPKVKGVSLTGSKPAGAAVASTAASEIKPSLLELGGSNALVVFEDCDIENTIGTCINARFQNTGQSCIAGKRLLVQKSIATKFINLLKEKIESLTSGDPLDENTYIGVMVNKEAAEELKEQLDDALNNGAKLITGGKCEGAYLEPTLVTEVTKAMRIFQEETFGPLLACTIFEDDEEAVELVNLSKFGLGVSLFTQDKQRIEKLIPQLDEGAVFVNELVKSDPRLPFGGVGISGYGRELSQEGILAFVNKKTIYIK